MGRAEAKIMVRNLCTVASSPFLLNLPSISTSPPQKLSNDKIVGSDNLNSVYLSKNYLNNFPGKLDSITSVPLFPPSDYTYPKYDFANPQAVEKFFPSVTHIIDKTKSVIDKKRLETWRQKQIEIMGQEAFEQSVKDRMNLGTELHEACYRYLNRSNKHDNENHAISASISPNAQPYWQSAKPALDQISELKYTEMKLTHPLLCYKGVFDAIAVYKNRLVLLEIKTSERPKLTLKSAFEYPLQVAAYAGIVNYKAELKLSITSGLILVCYPNEKQQATFLIMNEKEMQFYWKKWLKRLLLFWSYEGTGSEDPPTLIV